MTTDGDSIFNGQLDVAPWDALLLEVRRASYRVAWVDSRIETLVTEERALRANAESSPIFGGVGEDGMAPEDREVNLRVIERRIQDWLKESRNERNHLARCSKAAIDAGLSQRIVSQVQVERETITKVLVHALSKVELTDDQKDAIVRGLAEGIEMVALERRGDLVSGQTVGSQPGTSTGPVVMRPYWTPWGTMEYRAEPVTPRDDELGS